MNSSVLEDKSILDQVTEWLSSDSPLARKIPGFQSRFVQLQMAREVVEAIENQRSLVVEAGTGTGKTFAYLIPALLAGKKVIISTASKTLQDQLFINDIPLLKKQLSLRTQTALLKGRQNYLCRERIATYQSQGRFPTRASSVEFHKVVSVVNQVKTGDLAELDFIADNSPIVSYITSTNDNCLGQECDYFQDCFLVKARKKAMMADVIVINHHLFFADMLLKEGGFGELLPHADVIILDEAHQLPEIASIFFGQALSSRQLTELASDSMKETQEHAKDMAILIETASELQQATQALRDALGSPGQRKPWIDIANKPSVKHSLSNLQQILVELSEHLHAASSRAKTLAQCHERAQLLQSKLAQVTQQQSSTYIHWYETYTKAFMIHMTPLSVSKAFKEQMACLAKTQIYTSATLTINHQFHYFAQQLGFDDNTRYLELDSPFDYTQQAALYLPKNMPEPQSPHYFNAVFEAAIPVINAAQGRTFFLFTSHFALQRAAEVLTQRLKFPILIQGQHPKGTLLSRFKKHGNAVLLGTYSFWEGVDVKGQALCLVIIDKLPFGSPSDPILKARIQHTKQQGGNPFYQYQLSQAVIQLKQGVGRLIRDPHDKGLLMLMDPRIQNKSYGKIFIESLPDMQIIQDTQQAEEFLKGC